MAVEIVAIVAEGLAQAVAEIEHRGHTVETETIELILLHPELAVRQQEVKHLILTIVEAERIPCRMLTTLVVVEILIVGTIETTQSL